MGYYQDYIPSFAQIAKLLTDLTDKHASGSVIWDDELEEAFECLRQKLCSPPLFITILQDAIASALPQLTAATKKDYRL